MSRDRTDPLVAILETLQEINGTLEVIAARLHPRIVTIPRQREARVPNMCGCGHSPHIGLVCGYPIGRTQDRVKCECEG
jgi:hypothetical protein